MQVEDYNGEDVHCYNHVWESMSEEKAPLMDCFASSPKHTHENVVVVDSIIKVKKSDSFFPGLFNIGIIDYC